MSNNDIMKKLRVALQFTDDDIIEVLNLANFRITKTELGAISRECTHSKNLIILNFCGASIILHPVAAQFELIPFEHVIQQHTFE